MKDERGGKRNVRKEVKFVEWTETSKIKYSITFKYSLIKMRLNIFRNLEVKKTESPSLPLEGAQKAVSFKDFTQIMTNTRLYTGTTEQLV